MPSPSLDMDIYSYHEGESIIKEGLTSLLDGLYTVL